MPEMNISIEIPGTIRKKDGGELQVVGNPVSEVMQTCNCRKSGENTNKWRLSRVKERHALNDDGAWLHVQSVDKTCSVHAHHNVSLVE